MTCFNKQYSVLQFRRGLASEFTASNIVLASGEPAYAIDDQIFKIGDGITAWNDLDSFAISTEQVQDIVSNLLVGESGVNVSYDDVNDTLIISGSGFAPTSHNHISSDITNFNSSVSGLLPSISGVSGVLVTNANNLYTVSLNNPSIQLIDITDLSSDARAFFLTPSSSNLRTLVNDETGTGVLVFNDSPVFSGIPIVPTATSGTNTNQIASTAFVRTEISNLVDSAPLLLDTLNEIAAAINDDANFYITINNNLTTVSGIAQYGYNSSGILRNDLTTVSGITDSKLNKSGDTMTGALYAPSGIFTHKLTVGNIDVSVSGHTHTSSDITDFASSVSGLLPVKNIVGVSGIKVSSNNGIYTISQSGLLVAGTGVNLTYNDTSGTLTIDNRHSEVNVLSQEPQGFVNRNDSIISFNDANRTFTIQPANVGGSYDIYVEGIKVVKSGVQTVVIDSGTALNYIHFDTTPPYTLHTKTTGFNFDTDVPIAFIHWNSGISQSTFFGEERHGIRMDSVTHRWIHNTFGMQYISGLSIGGYVLLGNGSSNSHAQIDISDGILYQEDIIINITDDNGTNSANEFVQPLSPIAYIPTYYHSGSTGQWVRDVATTFPLKYNATRAQYNLYSGGTWTLPNVTNNRYFAMWIVATNDINDPILAIVGQREDPSLGSAESNNNWSDIDLTNIPTQELRPLYRLIFVTNDTFTNTPKSSLQSILDIRTSIQSVTVGVVQNDHGSLFGLADDDHSQYVHINNARTIDAVHTFSNGLNASGLINAASGNFTSLTVNNTGVSVVGHTHTSSSITDFNSSVSGLIPNIVGKSGIYINSINNTKEISSNFIAGNGIALNYNNDESLTISTATNNGVINISNNNTNTLTIPNGYSLGSLSIYQNGVKLLENIDYTATDGSEVVLTSPPTSGSYVEYITPTINNNVQNLFNSVRDTPIYDLGSSSGTVQINYGTDRMIQKLSINTNPLTLIKGSEWPTTNISRDILLQITCINPASITWTIVGSNWYKKPVATLPSGEYLVLLRAMGSGIIQGHYIGQKQGAL